MTASRILALYSDFLSQSVITSNLYHLCVSNRRGPRKPLLQLTHVSARGIERAWKPCHLTHPRATTCTKWRLG